MDTQPTSPLAWVRYILTALQWPVVVVAAFALGRYVQKLEMRVAKAETHITALVERHMPAIHRALAEIRGLLLGG
ncbi:MAG: hypothetical protein WB421_17375 [Terriglobales bacterium]